MNERVLLAGLDTGFVAEIERMLVSAGYATVPVRSTRDLPPRSSGEASTVAVLCDRFEDTSTGDSVRALQARAAIEPHPILVIGESDDPIDRIVALELGADDFVARAAPMREIALRVASLFRRRPAPLASPPVRERCGRIEIDRVEHRVWVDGGEVRLSSGDFRVLLALASPAGAVHAREALGAQLMDDSRPPAGRWLDARMARLRRHLGAASPQLETLRGVGFRLAGGA